MACVPSDVKRKEGKRPIMRSSSNYLGYFVQWDADDVTHCDDNNTTTQHGINYPLGALIRGVCEGKRGHKSCSVMKRVMMEACV